MSWPLVFTASARREIRKLDSSVSDQIDEDLDRLAVDPSQGKPMHGRLEGMRSWRSGDYRILYGIHGLEGRVVIYRVAHRREVYRRGPNPDA